MSTLTKKMMFPLLSEQKVFTDLMEVMREVIIVGDMVSIKNVGALSAHYKAPRPGLNPRTKEYHEVCARYHVNLLSNNGIKYNRHAIADKAKRIYGHDVKLVEDIMLRFYEYIRRTIDSNEYDRIELRGLGIFERVITKPVRRQNPKTLEKIMIPSKTKLHFKMGKHLKEALIEKAANKDA